MTAEFPGGKQQEVHDIAIHFTAVQCQASASLTTCGQCIRGTVHLLKEAQFPAHIEAATCAIQRNLVSLLSQLETYRSGVERLIIRGDAQYALNVRWPGDMLDVEWNWTSRHWIASWLDDLESVLYRHSPDDKARPPA